MILTANRARTWEAVDGALLTKLLMYDDAKREYAYGPAQGVPQQQGGHPYPGALRRRESQGLYRDQHEK
jgi:hypothetical protein